MTVYPVIHFDPNSGETTITTIADSLETALAIAEAEAKLAHQDDPDNTAEVHALKNEKGFEISIDGLLLEKWSVWAQPVRTSLAEWLATWEPA